MEKCIKCGKIGTHNELSVPQATHLLDEWFCMDCYETYLIEIEKFNKRHIHPERSKREDSEYGAKCDFGILKSEMRCSELYGNIERDK